MTAPPKVTATTTGITAAVSGVILLALQTWVFRGAAIPGEVTAVVYLAVPGLLSAAAGYLAHKRAPESRQAQQRGHVMVTGHNAETAAMTAQWKREKPWPPRSTSPPSVDRLEPPPVPPAPPEAKP